jgi:hypothetical protein
LRPPLETTLPRTGQYSVAVDNTDGEGLMASTMLGPSVGPQPHNAIPQEPKRFNKSQSPDASRAGEHKAGLEILPDATRGHSHEQVDREPPERHPTRSPLAG